jgi:N-acetylmuramoyl-L-alanine amidase
MEPAKASLLLVLLVIVSVCHVFSEQQENILQRTERAACPPIVSRSQWEARAPKSTRSMRRPVPKVFIHHTETGRCYTLETCKAIVKSVQNYHMDTRGWADIGYNFLVGDDGNIYEGRGWNNVGAHARDWNPTSYGISFLGNFQGVLPSTAALNAAKQLIACGRSQNTISASYTLHGHRDGVCTTCPGNALYNHISSWPRFGGKLTPIYC